MKERVALWGLKTLDNWGDRLIARAVETELARRLPNASFRHFCPWSTDPEQALPLSIGPKGEWPGAGEHDAIVVVGGALLGGPPFIHPIMAVFCFGPNPAEFAPGTFIAWNAVGLQDGVAARDRESWRAYLRAVFERLDYCTVRSDNTARQLTGDSAVKPPVVPDAAFALPPVHAPRRANGKFKLGVGLGEATPSEPNSRFMCSNSNALGGSPYDPQTCMSREDMWRYLKRVARQRRRDRVFFDEAIEVLRRLGDSVDVEFFGFGNMYGDPQLASRLAEQVPGSRLVDTSGFDFDTMQALLASYDGLILTRFHSIIMTLRTGRPFVAADPYWSNRTNTSRVQQLLELADLPGHHVAYDGAVGEGSDFAGAVHAMIEQGGSTAEVYSRLHEKSMSSFDRLAVAIEGG